MRGRNISMANKRNTRNHKHTRRNNQNGRRVYNQSHTQGAIQIFPMAYRGGNNLYGPSKNNTADDPAGPRDGINVNPPEYFAQSFKRVDIQTFDIHTKCLHTEDTYEKDAKVNAQHRVSWIIPETVKNKIGQDQKIFKDNRGQLSNVLQVKAHFKNHLHDTITVEGNLPHGDLVSKDVVVDRTNTFNICLKPLGQRTVTINKFGDKNNLFGPLITSDPEGHLRSMVLLDFTGKTPNVSEYTEQQFNEDRVAVTLVIEVKYVAMDHMPTDDALVSIVNRPKFGLQLLPSLRDMNDVSAREIISGLKTKVKGLSDPAPKWVKVEESHGDYICAGEVGVGNGYGIGLYHCDARGASRVPVALDGIETADTRIICPAMSVTTDRQSMFTVSHMKFSARHGLWMYEDPTAEDGLLNRADSDPYVPVVSKEVPLMVFDDFAPDQLVKAAGIQKEEVIDGLTKVIDVITAGLEIASFFL